MKKIRYIALGAIICGLIIAAIGCSFLFTNNILVKPEVTADDYIKDGNIYLDDGNYSMAVASYEKGLEMSADNIDILCGMAKAYAGLGYYEEEKACREKLTELCPDDEENWIGLVLVKLNLKELEEAKELTKKLMEQYDNKEIEELYEQMDVKKPVFNIEAGTYDSYQFLELKEIPDNASIYYTTDGSDPTENSMMYTEGIVVSYPQSVIKAIAIGHLGYQSEVTELKYEITVPIQDVSKKHFQHLWSIKDYLKKNGDSPLYNYEIAQIRSVYLLGDYSAGFEEEDEVVFHKDYYERYSSSYERMGEGDIEFLAYMPFVKKVCIGYQKNLDISVLENLTYLEELSLLNCNITDINVMKKLNKLKKLALGWNQIEDVTVLGELTQLESLGLWDNKIKDISALENMDNLRYFDVSGNQIESIDCIKNMSKLGELWIADNQINDFTPLASCEGLNVLMAGGNPAAEDYVLQENMDKLGQTDIRLGGE